MILKKPYAFFIKVFKPLHLLISLIIFYSIITNNKILNFLNNYLHNTTSVVGTEIKSTYINSLFYVVPIVVLVIVMIILGIMFKKHKPVTFYFICIFSFIVVLIINVYTANFLKLMEEEILSVSSVKLIHDLVLISVIIQSVMITVFIARGMSINFKKFDFDSDLSNIEISESDREEIEVNVNVDFDELKRKRKEKFRNLKYAYVENRFIINVCILSFCALIALTSAIVVLKRNSDKKVERQLYYVSNYGIQVNSTKVVKENYEGLNLSTNDTSLVAVNLSLNSSIENKFLYLNNFTLNIGGIKFKPVSNYENSLIDLGKTYKEDILDKELQNYLLVFEVPNKFTNSKMKLIYNGLDYKIDINLKPSQLEISNNSISVNVGELMSFEEVLGDIKFKINSFEVSDKFLISYNYCMSDNDCINSIEYLKPTINTTFDKYILKLNVEYSNNSYIDSKTFYDFLSSFGYISYKIGDKWYNQESNFEQIKSKKSSEANTAYIGVISDIKSADEIKIIFNLRNSHYEYILK